VKLFRGWRLISILTVICVVGIAGTFYIYAEWLAPRYPAGEWNTACKEQNTVSHPMSVRASDILLAAIEEDHGAGISFAVVVDGQIIWNGAAGLADFRDHALSTNARMRIGSVSKVFTAVIAAQLAERGMLDVDHSVREYVPELPDSFQPITIRNLANHTSGIRQYDFANLKDSNNTFHFESLSNSFARHHEEGMLAKPGEKYIYSSIAFNLLGIVIERATGLSYPQALDRWIAQPLKLSSTLTDDSTTYVACRPQFFSVLFGNWRIPTLWRDNSDLFPSGGLLSSASDLARFGDQVFRSPLLLPETRQMLMKNAKLLNGNEIRHGFGWEIQSADDGSILWIGHGGTVNGSYASLRFYPAYMMTVAAIANYDLQLTGKRASFFRAVRKELPALFSGENPSVFNE